MTGQRWWRALSARTPLRVRLVAAVLLLSGLALAAAGLAATTALRDYLLARVDASLQATAPGIADRLEHGAGQDRGDRLLPSEFAVRISAPDGTPIGELSTPLQADLSPARLPRLSLADVTVRGGRPFTVPSTKGGPPWRALALSLPDGSGSLVVSTSLDDVEATVDRLTRIDLVVGALVLLLLAGAAYALVRSSLRPLLEVERTAEAIAQGDLSRRIPDRDRRTEVGRLTGALNGMLGQIEGAFRDRAASEAAARRSEARMRRFVADASHELRTPLTSIRGFAELHRQGAVPAPADVERVMARIEDEAARMGLLVEDLLLLARLDQQRPLDRSPVDLVTVAADAVHDAQAVAPDRRVRLHPPEGEPPVVVGDEARLRQVAANLLANAVTHTPPGTPVDVRVGAAGGSATLEVADRGPGLREEEAARVFERFYRADPARSRGGGGSGLGLSIVAALVAAHGGTVDVHSIPGQGAVFRVTLPAASRVPVT